MTTPLDAILERCGLDRPDGRPLYRYRITAAESRALQDFVAENLDADSTRYGPATAKAFCLWAADYFRQSYLGGQWKWEGILDAVNASHLQSGTSGYRILVTLVRDGLQGWKRPLLKTAFQTEFLATIACEGGLPLRLVSQQNNAFRAYFRSLLRLFRSYTVDDGLVGGKRPESLAETAAKATLPSTLHQSVVYTLAGEIVQTIWRYRVTLSKHPDAPVTALDEQHPAWRDDLPLRLDDAEAEEFLRGLVGDAVSVVRETVPPIVWVRQLVGTMESGQRRWALAGTLEIASSVPAARLPTSLGLPERGLLRTRYQDGSIDPWARIVLHGEGGEKHYRVTSLPVSRRVLSSEVVAGTVFLDIQSGTDARHDSNQYPGGQGLSEDLPWVFALDDDVATNVRASFAGEGRCLVASRSAFVLLPAGWEAAEMDSVPEVLGVIDDLPERRVLRISATTRFRHSSGEQCTVRLNAVTASVSHFRIEGNGVYRINAEPPVYFGLPRLFEFDGAGPERRISRHELYWRSDLPGAKWSSLTNASLGAGTIRVLRDGEVAFLTRATLCPVDFRVKIHPLNEIQGQVLVSGLHDADAVLGDAATVRVQRWFDEDQQLVFDVTAIEANASPTTLRLVVLWPDRGRADFTVPFPAELVSFERLSGAPVANTTVKELSGCRAVSLSPAKHQKAWVTGELRNGPPESEVGTIGDGFQLEPGTLGQMPLDVLQADVEELLSSTDRLDAQVRLRFEAVTKMSPQLYITRYSLEMKSDRQGTCRIASQSWRALSPREKQQIRLVGIPLSSPGTTPVPLIRQDPPAESVMSPEWRLPDEGIPSGSWMVYGFDGLWSRVRPRLVVREPIVSWPEGTLRNAIERIPDDERMEALTAALSSMAIAPEHPEWELVHQLVKRTTDLPPAAFSVLRILPRVPDVWPDLCALLLLQSLFRDQEAPRLTVEAMEALPFSYASLPVGAIERATERIMHWLTEKLGAPDIALERLEARLGALPTPWMAGPIRRTAHAVVGEVPTDAPAASATRAWPTKAWQAAFALADTMPSSVPLHDTALRQAVQDQLAAVREQLVETGIPNEALKIRELALAPLAGALAACHDIQLSPTAQFQLRRILRRFGEPAQAALMAAYDYGLANRWSTPAPQTAPHV